MFPELNEHAELKKLAERNPQQEVISKSLLNVSLALVNTRSTISAAGSWIKDAISKFEATAKKANESSDKLAKAITIATWAGVGIAALTLIWDFYKTICLDK